MIVLGWGYEWTISPNTESVYYVWSLHFIGRVNSILSILGVGVRPVLYLSEDVYRVSGTGTITDPYIIGMAS